MTLVQYAFCSSWVLMKPVQSHHCSPLTLFVFTDMLLGRGFASLFSILFIFFFFLVPFPLLRLQQQAD